MTDDVDRAQVRALWKAHGGDWHGPNVEHFSIPEDAGFWPFIRAYGDQRAREALEKAAKVADNESAENEANDGFDDRMRAETADHIADKIRALIPKGPAND